MSQQSLGANESADVVIIGGGVIGLSVARALKKRGVTDITVIERNELGREASWAAGGILAPQVEADCTDDFFRLACASRDMYPSFASELKAESGIDVELDTTGTLYVAFSDIDEAELQQRFEWQQQQQLAVEWLTAGDARRLEPCLSGKVRRALRFPNDFQIENRKLLDALIIANRRSGIRQIEHCAANNLRVEHDMAKGVETSIGFLRASSVVIAAGAWSSSIGFSNSAASIMVEPMRGQMLCFNAPVHFAHHVIYSSRGYLIPRRDGRLLAGSTSEPVGFEKCVTGEGVRAIRSMATQIAPTLDGLRLVDSWAGFRPRTNDGLPVLGAAPEAENVFYATGHYRNGILLAPITAELMADLLVSGAASSLRDPFSPERVGLTDSETCDSRRF